MSETAVREKPMVWDGIGLRSKLIVPHRCYVLPESRSRIGIIRRRYDSQWEILHIPTSLTFTRDKFKSKSAALLAATKLYAKYPKKLLDLKDPKSVCGNITKKQVRRMLGLKVLPC